MSPRVRAPRGQRTCVNGEGAHVVRLLVVLLLVLTEGLASAPAVSAATAPFVSIEEPVGSEINEQSLQEFGGAESS